MKHQTKHHADGVPMQGEMAGVSGADLVAVQQTQQTVDHPSTGLRAILTAQASIPTEFGATAWNSPVLPIEPDVTQEHRWIVESELDNHGNVQRMSMSSQFGELVYGARPYPSWVFREAGAGGAITMPHSETPDGHLLVALLLENRPNMGGMRWCAVGGFIDPGETHVEANYREVMEEVGVVIPPVLPLGGMSINPNRAFFDADPEKGEGVRTFGMKVPFEWLTPTTDGGFRLRDGIQIGVNSLDRLVFFRAQDAIARTGDALALGAVAKLMASHYLTDDK